MSGSKGYLLRNCMKNFAKDRRNRQMTQLSHEPENESEKSPARPSGEHLSTTSPDKKHHAADRPAAIVTGASRGIGLAISETLLSLGYEVYGFGRNFPEKSADPSTSVRDDCAINAGKIRSNASQDFPGDTSSYAIHNPHFHADEIDLLDTSRLTERISEIMKKEPDIRVLINNAGCAWYGLHEELNAEKIFAMVRTNLELPMLLSQLLLRRLKEAKGYIINISSVTATENAPHAAAYGATKAGLLSFSRSLFAENRKYGLRVSCILPDLTDTDLYRNTNFRPSEDPGCALDPRDTANAVRYILTQPEGVVVPELMLRPQKNKIRKLSPL